jgi:hypothetical protein
MRKSFKIILIVVFSLLFLSVVLKGWFSYQEKYVCEPKIRDSVEKFIESIRTSEYEALNDRSMFIDKKHFEEVKSKISKVYSLEIKDWREDFSAYIIVKFNTGAIYALMLVTQEATKSLVTCWGAEYRVLTIR